MTTDSALSPLGERTPFGDATASPFVGGGAKADFAGRIVRSFNTWAYKREQPSDPTLLRSAVNMAVTRSVAVPFVLYWGKGPRRNLAPPDEQCLNYIATLGQRVRECYPPGASFTLLLTDTHADLNEHPAADVDCYFNAIQHAANARGFTCRTLSDVARTQPTDGTTVTTDIAPVDILDVLTGSAAKWYGGAGSPTDGAARYFQLNMQEKRAVEQQYPDSIFVTFNSSRHRLLFPERLPIFYMYSLKKGVAVKPWFLSEHAVTDGAAASFAQTD